jgi:EAL domain-containing protein (putative c-di-GMP-specific phosphodiesterase class I)
MKIVAEGVETDSCRETLTRLGCDQAQGYLFARPMPLMKFFSGSLYTNQIKSSYPP